MKSLRRRKIKKTKRVKKTKQNKTRKRIIKNQTQKGGHKSGVRQGYNNIVMGPNANTSNLLNILAQIWSNEGKHVYYSGQPGYYFSNATNVEDGQQTVAHVHVISFVRQITYPDNRVVYLDDYNYPEPETGGDDEYILEFKLTNSQGEKFGIQRVMESGRITTDNFIEYFKVNVKINYSAYIKDSFNSIIERISYLCDEMGANNTGRFVIYDHIKHIPYYGMKEDMEKIKEQLIKKQLTRKLFIPPGVSNFNSEISRKNRETQKQTTGKQSRNQNLTVRRSNTQTTQY